MCALAGGPRRRAAPAGRGVGAARGRTARAAFLPGTFIAEAVGAYGLRLHYRPAVAIFLVIGAVLFALLAWPGTGLGLVTSGRGRRS